MNKKRTIKPSHKQTLHYLPKAIQKEYAHKKSNLRLNDKGFLSKGTVVKFKIGEGRVLDAKANGHGSINNPELKNWICSLAEDGKTQIKVALIKDARHECMLEFSSSEVAVSIC